MESSRPAVFNSNTDQTNLNELIKVFRNLRNFQAIPKDLA